MLGVSDYGLAFLLAVLTLFLPNPTTFGRPSTKTCPKANQRILQGEKPMAVTPTVFANKWYHALFCPLSGIMQGLSHCLSEVLLDPLPSRQRCAWTTKMTKRHVFKPISHAPSRLRKQIHRLPRLSLPSRRTKAKPLTLEPCLLLHPPLLLPTPALAF